MLKYYLFIFVTIFCFGGCSFFGNLPNDLSTEKRENYWNEYKNSINRKESEAKNFLGKTKEHLKSYYGEPNTVNYDVTKYDKISRQVKEYEEQWVYTYKKGVRYVSENSYDLIFYLEKGVVREYKIFGKPFSDGKE